MSDKKVIQLELRKLGLSEKEAGVYLNSLEMGNVSVSQIAQKTQITRPTAYRVLESLEKKGLVILKKGLVRANSPDELLGLLRVEKRKIEEQEREFLRIISTLKSTHLAEKNSINVFEGEKGVDLALDDFSLTSAKNIKVIFSGNWKKVLSYSVLEESYKKIKSRLGKVSVQEIFLGEIQKSKFDFVKKQSIGKKGSDRIIIICEKIFLLDKEKIVVISQKDIIDSLKLIVSLI